MLLRTIMLFLYVHFGLLALMLFLKDGQLVQELQLLETEEFQNNFGMQQIFYTQDQIPIQYPLPPILNDIVNYIEHIGHECGFPKQKEVHKRDLSHQQPKITIHNTHLWQELHKVLNSHGHLPQTIFLQNQEQQLSPSLYSADVHDHSQLLENTIENNDINKIGSQYQQRMMLDNQVVPSYYLQSPETQQFLYDPPIKLEVTEVTQDLVNKVDIENNLQLEEWRKNGDMFQQSALPPDENEQVRNPMLPKQNMMVTMAQLLRNQSEPNIIVDNDKDDIPQANKGKSGMKNMWGIVGQISAAIAVIQAYLLVEAWEQINLANNVIFESERQISEISSNINLLFSATDHLLFLRNRWEIRKLHYKERRRIMGQIRKKMYRMGFLQYQTGKLLTDKKIALASEQNGKLLHQRQQLTNGLINTILLFLNAFQLYLSGEILSGGGSLFQLAIVATYLALPIGNVALYFLVGEQILSLRETENEIHQLEVTLESIIIHFQDTEDWLEFTIEDPAVANPYKTVDVTNNIPISGTFNAPGFNFSPFSQTTAAAATTTVATTAAATTPAATTPAATTTAATTPAATAPAATIPAGISISIPKTLIMPNSNPATWSGATEIKDPTMIVAMDPPINNGSFGLDVPQGKIFSTSTSNPNDYYDSSDSESDEWNPFDSDEE